MNFKFAKRVNCLEVSSTLAFLNVANEMKAKGIKVIDFGAGEPDFDTPDNIKKAGIDAIEKNFTKYTSVSGIDELKEIIWERYFVEQRVRFSKDEIIVTSGSKFSLFLIALVLFEKGDEVIVPKPFWVTYPELVKFTESVPKYARIIDDNGKSVFNADSFLPLITKKTKAIILNYPSNPTGSIIDEDSLKKLSEQAVKKDFYLIVDDCYRHIIFDNRKFPSIIELYPDARDKIIIIESLSKSYAMTGWRIGFTLASKEIIKEMNKIQSHSTSNPTSISQKAAVEALKGSQDEVEKMRAIYEKRRNLIVSLLKEIKGVKVETPGGAFYAFPSFKYYIDNGKFKNTQEISQYLLEKAHVICIPGESFGESGYMRFSFATSEEDIKTGISKIKQTLESI